MKIRLHTPQAQLEPPGARRAAIRRMTLARVKRVAERLAAIAAAAKIEATALRHRQLEKRCAELISKQFARQTAGSKTETETNRRKTQ